MSARCKIGCRAALYGRLRNDHRNLSTTEDTEDTEDRKSKLADTKHYPVSPVSSVVAILILQSALK
jgi:hypothetical protein